MEEKNHSQLDTLYLKDKTQSEYKAYDTFERFRRPSHLAFSHYINDFERFHSKVKYDGSSHHWEI